MADIVIIHFSPVELYPPVQNLIHALSHRNIDQNVVILTTHGHYEKLSLFEVNNSRIKIIRYGKSGRIRKALDRYWNYLRFYMMSFIYLLRKGPSTVMYFETLSSLPVILYTFFKSNLRVFIHYHEYTSFAEYRDGMRLTRFFYWLEKKIYPSAYWLSHTNAYRLAMFEKDIAPVLISSPRILPNYPPEKWYRAAEANGTMPVKTVYAGALSLDTMYTRQFAAWVNSKKGSVIWDIYSYNYSDTVLAYLKKMNSPWINLMEGVDYDDLPEILKRYQVGVVLYNGHIPNYVYNIPNKVYEYLACSLDVWVPHVMVACENMVTHSTFPKVLTIDFNKLEDFDFDKAIDRKGYNFMPPAYFCEVALEDLVTKLFNL